MPTFTFFNLPAKKREQITAIAIAEFAAHDYPSTSISRIVAEAGIAKGSFYQYFSDKKDLFQYLIDLIYEKKSEFFSLDRPDPQHVGIFAYLRWIAEIGVQFEQAYPELSRIGYRALYAGEFPAVFSQQTRQSAHAFYIRLVELGKQQGDIAPSVDTELAAFLFDTILSNLPAYVLQQLPEKGQSIGEATDNTAVLASDTFGQVVQILEHGMGAQGGQAESNES